MKRFLLALAVTGISANAWADIGNDHQCTQLTQLDINKACRGYDKRPSECYGLPTLVCPFDAEKVFCAHKNCEVGDIVYQDGRCYEDGSAGRLRPPNQSEGGAPLVAIGVVVDPITRLAVLPYVYWDFFYWQEPDQNIEGNTSTSNYMHASTCMNNLINSNTGSSSYSSSFPAPSGTSLNSCGNPVYGGNIDDIVQPELPIDGLGYNWSISPLLQKLLSPLKNFSPIKSVHAADVNYTSYGCAIPYVATNQEHCNSMVLGGYDVGGRFYTQKLMEFKNANSTTEFYVAYNSIESTDATFRGIRFPAAEYCSGITSISGTTVQAFLPSVNDLVNMIDNIDAISAAMDTLALQNGWEEPDGIRNEGKWSSQQAYSTIDTSIFWDKAMMVVNPEYNNGDMIEARPRDELFTAACFINY